MACESAVAANRRNSGLYTQSRVCRQSCRRHYIYNVYRLATKSASLSA